MMQRENARDTTFAFEGAEARNRSAIRSPIMVMKCPRCNGSLEITGFDGSAIHTRCPNCNIIARPKSLNPQPVTHFLSPKSKAMYKRQSVPVIFVNRKQVPI